MTKPFHLLTLAVLLPALGACSDLPTATIATSGVEATAAVQEGAAGRRYVEVYVEDLRDDYFAVSCEHGVSENVVLDGELVQRLEIVVLPNGSTIGSMSSSAHNLSGTGVTSGDEYRANIYSSLGGHVSDGRMLTYRDRIRLRNMATGESFDILASGRAWLDENWKIVREQEQLRVSCPE